VKLAAALLLMIGVTHYGYDLLAHGHADQAQAARAWFYTLRGMEGAALLLVVWALVRRPLVGAVCLWGACEEAQTAVCRVAHGIGDLPPYEPFVGLCGVEMYWLGIAAAAVLATSIARRAA
jgi:hypothetical protein